MDKYELYYQKRKYKKKSLLDWAIIWFKTSNDVFYTIYGFNFNPHEYPMLYEIARRKVYG